MESINVSVTHTDVEVVTVAMAGPRGEAGGEGGGGGDTGWRDLDVDLGVDSETPSPFSGSARIRRIGSVVYVNGSIYLDGSVGTEVPSSGTIVLPTGFGMSPWSSYVIAGVRVSGEFSDQIDILPAFMIGQSMMIAHGISTITENDGSMLLATQWVTDDPFPDEEELPPPFSPDI